MQSFTSGILQQKTKIMASGPITSWQIDGKTTETEADFIFLGSKITADSDCSREIKRCLLHERKAMINLDSILKIRDIALSTKVHLVKVFPVVMYGCESWTIKKAECWRIDAFELWCWRKLLRVPWTTRRSNQSILKEISPEFTGRTDAEGETLFGLLMWRTDAFELWYWRRLLRVAWTARKSNQSMIKETNPEYSLEGLKLKLQYFGHLMWRADSLEKTLMLGKIEGRKKGQHDEMVGWDH